MTGQTRVERRREAGISEPVVEPLRLDQREVLHQPTEGQVAWRQGDGQLLLGESGALPAQRVALVGKHPAEHGCLITVQGRFGARLDVEDLGLAHRYASYEPPCSPADSRVLAGLLLPGVVGEGRGGEHVDDLGFVVGVGEHP